jgi:hypothetical protein
MPVSSGVAHREAPERLPEQRKPHGSCGSPADPLDSPLAKDPAVPGPTRHGSPRRRGFVRVRGMRGRKPLRRCGSDVLRRGLGSSGTTAVEPGQGRLKRLGACGAFRPRIPQSSRLGAPWARGCSGCGNASRPSCPKELFREEPRSGSGPSVSARPEGEEPVEGVRNPEDGTCRVRQTRVMRIPPPMSLKGREPQEGRPGPAGPGRALRPEP